MRDCLYMHAVPIDFLENRTVLLRTHRIPPVGHTMTPGENTTSEVPVDGLNLEEPTPFRITLGNATPPTQNTTPNVQLHASRAVSSTTPTIVNAVDESPWVSSCFDHWHLSTRYHDSIDLMMTHGSYNLLSSSRCALFT